LLQCHQHALQHIMAVSSAAKQGCHTCSVQLLQDLSYLLVGDQEC
jgi:hypothetical protein